ncbi:hypothetical protein N7474_008967 [Penicillium riverlandense]|uniref:uncharacterized protein n=1 Tax=Penicillium riverlandense TaxID=1903569 RepID=UPI00254870FD|nr:uncharacterized protein N7474_008967 [Penicillium riverlandense]KAJ5812666.1 hypothetical protein N7474_008967 [Penicillium riverlandense]
MDPKRPVDFGFAIQHAFAESDSKPERSLSFKFPPDLQESTRQDLLSSLPSELRLRILEMLPTASILNLFLASSAFRQLRENLSQTFWKSRLYFDVPWCADMVLKQVNSQKNKGGYVRFHRLLRDVIDTSRFGAYGPIGRGGKRTITKDSLALRNRRHVWLNCERILEDIEARQAIAREQAGPIWTGSRGLISRKVASVSHPSTHRPEITSDVYFASYQDRTSQLKGITAHMTHQGHIIGIELHLSHEHSSQPHSNRLLGNRGELTDKVTIVSSASVVAVMISFGSIQQNQDQSAMVALSLVVEDRPSEPTYTVGSWNDGDVVQILFADTGMEVIGLTGEFNVCAHRLSY